MSELNEFRGDSKYEEFEVASAQSWAEFKTGMDKALEELRASYKRASSHFT